MNKQILIITAALVLAGCGSLNQQGGIVYRFGQERKLANAVELLEKGKIEAATQLLATICSEAGVPGVTDEALLRLSVLRLESVLDKKSVAEAQHNLDRLGKEYPASSWAPLASSLSDFIDSTESVRLEDKKLKESNLALSKENRELRQSIEKLRNLEIELSKGSKR